MKRTGGGSGACERVDDVEGPLRKLQERQQGLTGDTVACWQQLGSLILSLCCVLMLCYGVLAARCLQLVTAGCVRSNGRPTGGWWRRRWPARAACRRARLIAAL